MTAKISVIIPAFNRASILSRAIDSVRSQSFADWELFIVDDRSTDSTKDLVEGYRKQDPRIFYLLNENPQGPGGARNFGIENSKGKYLAFLDSDDVWFPNHLMECLKVLETEPVYVCGAFWYENIDGKTIEENPRKDTLKTMIVELRPRVVGDCYIFDDSYCEYVFIRGFFPLKTSFFMIDRIVLEKSGRYDDTLRTNQDVDFFFNLTRFFRVALIDQIHGVYFQGLDNLYFFKNWLPAKENAHLLDDATIEKLRFHRTYLIRSLRKRMSIIRRSNEFICKPWLLASHCSFIVSAAEIIVATQRRTSFWRSKWYGLVAFYYGKLLELYFWQLRRLWRLWQQERYPGGKKPYPWHLPRTPSTRN